MDILQSWLENSQTPLLSALILGLMTAISPCPLATNITAIGYIGKDVENRKMVFTNGLIYTLGRGVAYFLIGLIFFFGLGQFQISEFLQNWGEKILGPLLILIGLMMLGVFQPVMKNTGFFQSKIEKIATKPYWGSFLLGILFALAFCPYSGVLYFGLLIPMTISSPEGLYLPLAFAFTTGLPVIFFAWVIAFSLGSINSVYTKIKSFEKWMRNIVAILFIIIGIYYLITVYL